MKCDMRVNTHDVPSTAISHSCAQHMGSKFSMLQQQ